MDYKGIIKKAKQRTIRGKTNTSYPNLFHPHTGTPARICQQQDCYTLTPMSEHRIPSYSPAALLFYQK